VSANALLNDTKLIQSHASLVRNSLLYKSIILSLNVSVILTWISIVDYRGKSFVKTSKRAFLWQCVKLSIVMELLPL